MQLTEGEYSPLFLGLSPLLRLFDDRLTSERWNIFRKKLNRLQFWGKKVNTLALDNLGGWHLIAIISTVVDLFAFTVAPEQNGLHSLLKRITEEFMRSVRYELQMPIVILRNIWKLPMGCALSCLRGYYRKLEWFISGPPVTADNRENGRDILDYL